MTVYWRWGVKDLTNQNLHTTLTAYTLAWDTENWCCRILLLRQKLHCCTFNWWPKSGDTITNGQYMNYQTIINWQFRLLLKFSFRITHFDSRDTISETKHLVSVDVSRLVLRFGKASISHYLTKKTLQDVCFKTSGSSILCRYWSTVWKVVRCTRRNYWMNRNWIFQ